MKKILIIDDNPSVRNVLSEMLNIAGYQTIQAQSGAEGIQLQKQDPADLVISDLCMPQKSGIATIEELRNDYPDLKIIAISGGPGSEATTGFSVFEKMLEAALEVGAAITLRKPISSADLIQHVQQLLDQ